MSGLKPITNLYDNSEYFWDFQTSARDPFFERLSFQQFDSNEVQTLSFVDFVNGADVGVIKCGCGLRFVLEALQSLRVPCQKLRQ